MVLIEAMNSIKSWKNTRKIKITNEFYIIYVCIKRLSKNRDAAG